MELASFLFKQAVLTKYISGGRHMRDGQADKGLRFCLQDLPRSWIYEEEKQKVKKYINPVLDDVLLTKGKGTKVIKVGLENILQERQGLSWALSDQKDLDGHGRTGKAFPMEYLM